MYTCYKFADDLVLFSDSANGLHKQLTALYKYASLLHIIVSIPKPKLLLFNKRYASECDNFYYGDNVIEKAEKYKYRPVVGKLSPVIAFKVFDCQILPILEYASDIRYTGDSVNDLIYGDTIYGDTGRFPLIIRQHIKAAKYWCRILDLSQNHPVSNAYSMLLDLDGTGLTNWCSRIRSVLELTGLDQAWEMQHISNTNKLMFSFKDSIVRIFTQRWRQDIESSSKLRTYSLVKKYLCVEPYILNLKGNHLITAMARYRMSSHDLKIERGRYNDPITPINQRICTRCESNEIDDEIHLLLHCNAMNNEREILLNSVATIINMQPLKIICFYELCHLKT